MTAAACSMRHWLGFSLALACGGRTDDVSRDDAEQNALASARATPDSADRAPSSPPYLDATQVPVSVPATSAPAPPLSALGPAPEVQPPQQPAPPPPETPRPDAGATSSPPSCFDYLGDWITCENAGWPNTEKTDATDLPACMQACLQRRDCTAVTEYFWMNRPDLGCWLYTSTCNAPAGGVWQEEDGGKQYVRTCPAP